MGWSSRSSSTALNVMISLSFSLVTAATSVIVARGAVRVEKKKGDPTVLLRLQEKACTSDSRFGRKLSGTTRHRLVATQRPQMLCVAVWVWFCPSTEFVGIASINKLKE